MKKLALILASVLVGAIAQAEVKPDGTLLPYACSANQDRGAVEVCFATKVRQEGSYVTVMNEQGTLAVHRVIATTALPTDMAGTKTKKELTVRLESLIFPNGYVSIPFYPEISKLVFESDLSGRIESYALTGELSGSVIDAKKFEIQYHTQVTL